jgi:hypothetical protein
MNIRSFSVWTVALIFIVFTVGIAACEKKPKEEALKESTN